MEVRFIDVYFNISQALLGYITLNMRAITIRFDNKAGIILKVYLEKDLTNIDRENIYSALFEAEGMFDKRIGYVVEFITTKNNLTADDMLDYWMFMRYEHMESE